MSAGLLPPASSSSALTGLVGPSAIFAFGNGLSRVVAYALPPLLASWMAPAEMGTVALLTVSALILRTVLGLGLTTSLGALYFDGPPENRGAVIGTTAFVIAISGVLGIALCLVMPAPLGRWLAGGTPAPALLALAFAGVSLQLLAQPFAMALQFERRPLAHLLVTGLTAAIGVSLALVLVVGFGRGAQGWLEAGVLSGLAGVALAAVTARTPLFRARRDIASMLVRLGWPFVPSAAAMAVVQGAGPFVLARLEGLAAAGVYNAGYSLGMLMSLATTGFSAAWFPYFQSFATRQHEAPRAFARVLTACIGLFGCASILFYAAAPLATMLLPDPRYGGAVHVIGDVALTQALIGVWGVLVPVLYFTRRIWIASAVQGVAALVTAVATVGLIGWVGPADAALGAVVGAGAMVLLQLAVNRRTGSPVGTFATTRHGMLATLVVGAALTARWMAANTGPAPSLVAGLALVLVTVAATWLAGRRAALWS